MCEATTHKIHPFTKSGLGEAPFRFVGMTEQRGPIKVTDPKTGVTFECGSPGQPMGSCDHCGTGIAFCYAIESADGKRSVVGCDCILKLALDSNARSCVDAALIREVKAEKRKLDRAARQRRAAEKLARLEALMADTAVRATLAAMPHPSAWAAEKGETGLDHAEWMLRRCGDAGRARLLKWIEKVTG